MPSVRTARLQAAAAGKARMVVGKADAAVNKAGRAATVGKAGAAVNKAGRDAMGGKADAAVNKVGRDATVGKADAAVSRAGKDVANVTGKPLKLKTAMVSRINRDR